MDIRTAIAALPERQSILGLDLGTKTIGIAISDQTRCIATPLTTILRKKFTADAMALVEIIDAENPGLMVLGLPLNMDGSEGPRVQATRAFARNFARFSSIGVYYWDERLSTAAVERMLIEADATRARRDAVIDKLAAAYILQSALDAL